MADQQQPSDEFDDAISGQPVDGAVTRFDVRRLANPVVFRSTVGVAMALAIVFWPARTDEILARLVGLGLLLLGAASTWTALRAKPRRALDALGAAVAAVVGLGLLAAPPDRSSDMLGDLLGALALGWSIRLVIGVIRRTVASRPLALAEALLLLGTGALLIAFPHIVLTTVIVLFGVGWAVVGVIAVLVSIDTSNPDVSSHADAGRLVVQWLHDRPKSADDREVLYRKILYDGADAKRRVSFFFALMTFASVIAATGVVADSTAVVIGAMLIAPLMTPLMGMAISLVMGWPNRLARSAVVAGAGILLAIAIGGLVGLLAPIVIDTTANTQIVSRSSPTILDLVIAVAAGAAGAYGLSRPDVSDSLPGVAIAIALVPPLTVVGISYSQGDWGSGNGALLLFTTNMLAILIVGGIMFVATGVTPLQRLAANQHRTRTSLTAVAGLGTFVVAALLLNGAEIAQNVAGQDEAEAVVEAWIEPHPEYTVVSVDVDGGVVTTQIAGPRDSRPDTAELADALGVGLGRDITAEVQLIVQEFEVATSSD